MRLIRNFIASSIISIILWKLILLVVEAMCKIRVEQIAERAGDEDDN